jgi:hypothetical protein
MSDMQNEGKKKAEGGRTKDKAVGWNRTFSLALGDFDRPAPVAPPAVVQ